MVEETRYSRIIILKTNNMYNWFEVKVSYEKVMETGLQKKVAESYLVDALSHAEAEARAIEEMRPYISGVFTITTVKRAKYAETFIDEDGDRWYKAKVAFITIDEKSGMEKRQNIQMLAQASTLTDAVEVIDAGMKGTMADYVITGVNETMILDIFPYKD